MALTINSGAVSRITGVRVNTLNMWVVRNLIPRMPATGYGNARDFDANDTLFVAVMVALVKLGYGAAFGATAAATARDRGFDRPGSKLIISPPRRGAYGLNQTPSIDHVTAETREQLDAALDRFIDGRPEVYAIVELDRIAERVRRAFNEPDLAERAKRRRGATAESPLPVRR